MPRDGKIEFSATTEITVREAVTKSVTEVTIDRIIDYPIEKKLAVLIREVGLIEIASGDAYDSLGDWTKEDVYTAINSKYSRKGDRGGEK